MAAFGGSKFRHTKGAMHPKDRWYTEISPSQTSDANVISVSDSHLAVVLATNGGGDVGTLPLEATGKRKEIQMNVIHAHAGRQIFDVQYSPFDASQLATCADDGCIKVWNVDGSEVKSLKGHQRRCEVIRFNHAASGVLASGSIDKTANIWDLETGQSAISLSSKGSVEGLSWNYDGSLLVSTGNDKTVRVWDPRKETAVAAGECHLGVKAQRCVWLGNTNKFFTTGLSKFREREFAIWDASDLSKPLKRATIDSSTGVLIPLVDRDTNIIYLSGKGDSSVRSYEMTSDKNCYKDLQGVSFSSGFKCIALAPKRIMNVMDCEINRVFGVLNDAIAPITYTVPRKNKVDFQADLFPDTYSQTPNDVKTSDWFAGKSAPPVLQSMEPNRFIEKREEKKVQEIKKKEEEKANEWKPKVLTGIVRSTRYRHAEGKEAWRRDHYTNVKADCSTRDSNPIAANGTYFAVPWAGPGGRLAVIPQKRVGKLPDNGGFGMIETGSNILDFAFNPHDDSLLATGNENAHAYIWKVDDGLMDLKDARGRAVNYTGKPLVDLKGHYSKVTFTSFHPTAKDVLLTSSLDGTVKFWDASVGEEKFTLENTIEDLIQSVDWNWDGNLMAFSSHDRKIKLLDPRAKKVVQEAVTHQGAIGVKLAWMGNTPKIITSGFGRSADRELGLWDSRKLDGPLAPFTQVDQAQALLTPYYDHDHRVVWLAAKGDGTIPFFEVVDEAPFFHYLNKYPTNVPQMGVARLPKKSYDVKGVEICRMLKLTVDTVIPISFTVPRTRKEFFQDDIYCPTWDEKPVMSAGEWFGGATKARKTIDLKPADMKPLSQAPSIERAAKYKFDPNAPKKQSETSYLSSFYDKMVTVKTEGGAAAQDEKEKQRVDQFNVGDEEMEWDDEDWDEAY